MARPLKEVVRCPTCGSADVVYTCEPKCCFNHVCADCRSSFQIVTRKTGRGDRETAIEAREPDSGEPAAACAACESLKLAVLGESTTDITVLCADCRAVLELAYEEIAPTA